MLDCFVRTPKRINDNKELIFNRTGTILINFCQYGIPETGEWFQTVMQVFFWVYASIAVLASSGMYLILWSTQ
jgi:hypothetical protein